MKEDRPMFLGASQNIFHNAEMLRNSETESEKLLWSHLSNKKLGVKFRRQHPILTYVVDFYCHSHKLVIELDGEIHNKPENQSYDQLRSEELKAHGLRVIRFWNHSIHENIDDVLRQIRTALNEHKRHTSFPS